MYFAVPSRLTHQPDKERTITLAALKRTANDISHLKRLISPLKMLSSLSTTNSLSKEHTTTVLIIKLQKRNKIVGNWGSHTLLNTKKVD